MTSEAIRVLEADPGLGDVLSESEFEEARRDLVAPSLTLAPGDWNPRHGARAPKGLLGALVTSGILCREVSLDGRVCAELVGPGDLLRPWDGGGCGVVHDVRWRVLQEARVALLGIRFATTAARWPALTGALVARSVHRSHGLALSAAITCTTGLDKRLLMLFSNLAARWGRVRPEGVLVPVPMTHELIGRLIGASRPSVSTALKALEREGAVLRAGEGWLLLDPPLRLVQGDDRAPGVAAEPAVAAAG